MTLHHPVWDELLTVAILRCVTWLIHVCDMTHSCVWYDVFTCVTWRIHESWCELPYGGHSEVCNMTHSRVWLDSFMCVTWRIHVCDMTHLWVMMWAAPWWPFWGVWHDSFMCVTLTHSRVWHDSFMCVTWLIHVCDMTHLYVWHDWMTGTSVYFRETLFEISGTPVKPCLKVEGN